MQQAPACQHWCGQETCFLDTIMQSEFSRKVFVGGVPWDITEEDLAEAFNRFGPMKTEWPASFPNHDGSSGGVRNAKGIGYVYVIFEKDYSVLQLLGSCNYEFSNGTHNFFYKVSSQKMRHKMVQIIPWQVYNSQFIRTGACLAPFQLQKLQIFVGSLHGMITAEGLAQVMEDLFGGVIAASLDTDKYKYPIGSGRVIFSNDTAYFKAIASGFVELRTQKFSKKIQIDPFLEDSECSVCGNPAGDWFCREIDCYKYFCRTCWDWQHRPDDTPAATASNGQNGGGGNAVVAAVPVAVTKALHIPMKRNPRGLIQHVGQGGQSARYHRDGGGQAQRGPPSPGGSVSSGGYDSPPSSTSSSQQSSSTYQQVPQQRGSPNYKWDANGTVDAGASAAAGTNATTSSSSSGEEWQADQQPQQQQQQQPGPAGSGNGSNGMAKNGYY